MYTKTARRYSRKTDAIGSNYPEIPDSSLTFGIGEQEGDEAAPAGLVGGLEDIAEACACAEAANVNRGFWERRAGVDGLVVVVEEKIQEKMSVEEKNEARFPHGADAPAASVARKIGRVVMELQEGCRSAYS